MNFSIPKLAPLVVFVGLVGVVGYQQVSAVFTPTPANQSMANLRDAGITVCQPVAVQASEKDVSRQTIKRINRQQPGLLRPDQRYFEMLRTARCCGDKYLDGGYGNCIRQDGGSLEPFTEEVYEYRFTAEDGGRVWLQSFEALPLDDGGMWLADRRNDGGLFTRIGTIPKLMELSIQSLRQDLDGGVLDDDGGVDDAGDNNVIDDALQVGSIKLLHCNQVDDLVDAGKLVNPYQTRFCGGLNRVALQPSPCMIPNGWGRSVDGGWCEETECLVSGTVYRPCDAGDTCGQVDCKFIGPYGTADGGPRWNGFNARDRIYAVGSACVPVQCGVSAGDVPSEWL